LTKVSVAFITDRHYVIPTVVAVTSLLCNKKPDTYYDIYIIAADLSNEEIEKFYELGGSSAGIHIIKSSLERFKGMHESTSGYITFAVYLKFDLPDLIPDQDKVLYLDSDIIIQKDLSGFFEKDIKDYYAGVIKDIALIDNELNIKNYFNAGVMLLNLKLMRENGVTGALHNIAASSGRLKYMDQDCLNLFFNNKVKLLPAIYNCFYGLFLQQKEKYPIENINKCFETEYSSLDNLKKESYIIHLVGSDKPWIYYNSVFTGEWDEYFKKSPLKLYRLKRKSIKLREYIFSHNWTYLLYVLFKYWNDDGLKFVMSKVGKRLLRIFLPRQ